MFDLNRTKILVVDDMLTMRKLVMKICREIGFTNFAEATDGSDAWQQISSPQSSFGLVISDWNMPNSSGLDLLKRVRSDSRFAKLPFIMVTAEAEQHQIVDAVQSGVTDYVIKPFTTQILRDKLEAAHKSLSG